MLGGANHQFNESDSVKSPTEQPISANKFTFQDSYTAPTPLKDNTTASSMLTKSIWQSSEPMIDEEEIKVSSEGSSSNVIEDLQLLSNEISQVSSGMMCQK